MSDDMSMFKKMKERITDEVNSATNKLQNMQLMDQLAAGIQQINTDMTPNQLLPMPGELKSEQPQPIISQFSLIDGVPASSYNEDEELNSEISPQHQLFNERNIKRINLIDSSSSAFRNENNQLRAAESSEQDSALNLLHEEQQSVIFPNLSELSSDIEDGFDGTSEGPEEDPDVEIDLLSDKPVTNNGIPSSGDKSLSSSSYVTYCKTRYRHLVHTLRRLSTQFESERDKLQKERKELVNQLAALKSELEVSKQQHQSSSQHDSLISVSTNVSENDKSSAGSPQPATKSSNKVKDLERLIAKCKETLKLKNSQIQSLKNSLSEVDKFKDSNQELRQELADLREAHETWTVSIAENKRVMHQEIESKNAEIERAKAEANELQLKLNDSNNKIRQHKSAIQDLENRLVSTSAAHQKERESLKKELTQAKNAAIRQLQKDHELHLERVKLDLEKSIETLKQDILVKDEHVMRSAKQEQQMREKCQAMTGELENAHKELMEQTRAFADVRQSLEETTKLNSETQAELEQLRAHECREEEFRSMNLDLSKQIKDLEQKLEAVESTKVELESKLSQYGDRDPNEGCSRCSEFEQQIRQEAEKFQQELHELTTKLNLMTTANEDQEKAIVALKSERDTQSLDLESLKCEIENLTKRNTSLAQVIQEHETDMQLQQEQLGQLSEIKHELDAIRRENMSMSESLAQLRMELSEKNSEIAQSKSENDHLVDEVGKLRSELDRLTSTCDELKGERDSLTSSKESISKQRRDLAEMLVVRILATMKNLETPNASPGSDKSYDSTTQPNSDSGDSGVKSLPDPLVLMEELSSLALDRSNAYMNATQRLQAVLLENNMMGEEIARLKDELNCLNEEKMLEIRGSIDEAERLKTENQALIHDRQSYEDRISFLEKQVDELNEKLVDLTSTAGNVEQTVLNRQTELEDACRSKEDELGQLKQQLADRVETEKDHLADLEDNRSLLENYQQKIEDLEIKLSQFESESEAKNEQISQLFNELQRSKDSAKNQIAETVQQPAEQSNGIDRKTISELEAEKTDLLARISALEEELKPLQAGAEGGADHTYQIRALQRVLQQYQEENQRLKESQRNYEAQKNDTSKNEVYVPDSTEFEYLKNIVYQFMLGKEPLMLARVISAVFKFDQSQVEQICRVQETVQSVLKQNV